MKILKMILPAVLMLFTMTIEAAEYHVSVNGMDTNNGSKSAPFKTIFAASQVARAGDTITVHEGIYREQVNPLYGGKSPLSRIVYQAAKGEKVIIKGSEQINTWKKMKGSVWTVKIANTFFNGYNPFSDVLSGDWHNNKGMDHHTGEVFLNGKSLFEKTELNEVLKSEPYEDARNKMESIYTWYAEVGADSTTIWANFQNYDPNKELVEINVRRSCFYPDKQGVNYITVRGFVMTQAATQWAAPTAEQIGLIGTHWSKGWIIEDNTLSNSKAVGITLGKNRATGHNVWSENRVKDGSVHYNEVIFRALETGWSKDNIGSHIVRNNVIFNCEQAGIVGSLGAVYSEIYNNHIYDIWVKRIFTGAEIAGIKIHAPIDMLIKNNRIHNTGRGIWLDWMTQGARVSSNLIYDSTNEDLFFEVNHGPYVVDNNILLSNIAVRDWSQGGAYVHNLIAGKIELRKVLDRFTPYHFAHSTKIAGFSNINAGDNRFLNNIFIKPENGTEVTNENSREFYGLNGYELAEYKNLTSGNIYFNGAKPEENEKNLMISKKTNPDVKIVLDNNTVFLEMTVDSSIFNVPTETITTGMLGTTFISEAMFENTNGSPYILNSDYFGKDRNDAKPLPGPIENIKMGRIKYKVW